MDVLTLYQGSDMLLELEGLTDEASGAVLNGATVSCTLKDSAGVPLTGETWPKAMPYVASTDGVYRAALPTTLVVTPGGRYTAEILAINAGQRALWRVDVLCKTRRR